MNTDSILQIPVADLDASIATLESKSYQLDRISPADEPTSADLSNGSGRVRICAEGESPLVALDTIGPDELEAMASGRVPAIPPMRLVEWTPAKLDQITIPPGRQSLVISRASDNAGFPPGRVGMGYRDLIPDRFGGQFIASNIRIETGGKLSDYVHYHQIRFQLIFCRQGWVKVVYEDQGPPFVLEPGDCILQAPEIRHRVLESSPKMEVVEVGCPAAHDTLRDHDMTLPTGRHQPDRLYGDQRFVHHVARKTPWQPGPWPGFEYQETGIGSATNTMAGVRVLRPASSTKGSEADGTQDDVSLAGGQPDSAMAFDSEFVFRFILSGSASLELRDRPSEDQTMSQVDLTSGDSVAIPNGMAHRLSSTDPDTQILEVTLPEWPELIPYPR